MKRILTAVIIGGGCRGQIYSNLMKQMTDRYRVTAVAEPLEERRRCIQNQHGIPDENCFEDWRDLLKGKRKADVAVIATMDRQHYEPVMEAIRLHYDILLEKPVSPFPDECLRIAEYAEQEKVKILVCHVLRYAPFFTVIKKLITDGRLGRIISVNHEECVGNIHQSHSFVRGNWGNTERSSCMLLQKSCHDLDILQWLIGKKCRKVQSFGSLSYFTPGNRPEGAPEYCMDGCPRGDSCPYNAEKLYLKDRENTWFREMCTGTVRPSDEEVERALRTTQYGKCVFACDNDAVDHQTVSMLFEDDITVTFTMCAFNKGGRNIHIMGTKGELTGSMDSINPILLYDFETGMTEKIPFTGKDGIVNGHGGGDRNILISLYDLLAAGNGGPSVTDIRTSVSSHLLAFAAEESRKTGKIIDFEEYISSL